MIFPIYSYSDEMSFLLRIILLQHKAPNLLFSRRTHRNKSTSETKFIMTTTTAAAKHRNMHIIVIHIKHGYYFLARIQVYSSAKSFQAISAGI